MGWGDQSKKKMKEKMGERSGERWYEGM